MHYFSIWNFVKIFENFVNISLENCEIFIILGYFSKNLTNHGLVFCAFGRKLNVLEILRKFRNFWKIFLRKWRKMHDFRVFFKRFNEFCGNFSRVWMQMQIVENLSKIFQRFSNIFLGQLLKTHYFSMFSKNLIIPAFDFRAFGRKTQFVGKFWENFNKNIAKNALFLHILQ